MSNKIHKANLFIIGINKAGSSWLYYLLKKHPDIFISKPKELNYFGKKYPKNIDKYESNFNFSQNYKYFGEATPFYHRNKKIAEQIYEYCPQAKIIAIVRDPIKRIVSQFHYHKQIGKIGERISINDIYKLKETCIFSDSHYEETLPYYEKLFGDNFKIVSLEEFQNHKSEIWREIIAFLEIKKISIPENIKKPENATGGFIFRIIYKNTIALVKKKSPQVYKKMLKSNLIRKSKIILLKLFGKANKETLKPEIKQKLENEFAKTYKFLHNKGFDKIYKN